MSETNHTRSHEAISTDPITDPVEALRRWHDGTFALRVEDVGRAVGEVLSKLEAAEKRLERYVNGVQTAAEISVDRFKDLESRLDTIRSNAERGASAKVEEYEDFEAGYRQAMRTVLTWFVVERQSQNCEHDWVNHMSCRKCGESINSYRNE